MPKISVIIPVYNTEKYLDKCIQSILNQTFGDFEIIAIDDGSTDSSLEILKKYEKDQRFIIIHKENEGQAVARNIGIKKATGKYITFVDSDDYIDKNMLEDLYHLVQEKDADIAICDILKESEREKIVFKNYWDVNIEKNKNMMTSHMGPVARLYKKELFINHNIFFKEKIIYEDLATVPLLAMASKKIEYINKPYYHYIIRENSTMQKITYSEKLENIFDVMTFLENKITPDYKEELEYLYIEHLLYSASLRFFKFKKKDMLFKIQKILKQKYPNYTKNMYYKKKSIKFKIVCYLFYHRMYFLLSLITKGR